jgi:hypothetical protein
VDHPDRPSVRRFWEGWYDRSLVINGVLVPSIAHPASLRRLMTGGPQEGLSDWPARLAAARVEAYSLPHVVISGPSYAGIHGEVVCRTGTSGQLAALLAGDLYTRSDVPVGHPNATAEARIDRYVDSRAAALLATATAKQDRQMLASFVSGLARGEGLKQTADEVPWGTTTTFTEQAALAVDVLALGLARCVTLAYKLENWDSHTSNDYYQNREFEGLFGELCTLMEALDATPGTLGGTMAEQTVVVVVSEMGRAPLMNGSDGKDHWPYTSALLVGPGLTTDRVVGAYDERLYGQTVDLASAEASASGEDLDSQVIGATLLALGDVDPSDVGGAVLEGVLGG